MVTKHRNLYPAFSASYILAKNHMVTKQQWEKLPGLDGYILAKNHMVTKRAKQSGKNMTGYILAKNHMVTKPQIS